MSATPGTSSNPLNSSKRTSIVTLCVAVGVSLMLLAAFVRVGQLQVRPSRELVEQMKPRISQRNDLAQRGDLLDRRYRLLASSRVGRRVVIDPEVYKTHESLDDATRRLAGAMGKPFAEVRDRIAKALEENAKRDVVLAQWKAEHPELKERAVGDVATLATREAPKIVTILRQNDDTKARAEEAAELPSLSPDDPFTAFAMSPSSQSPEAESDASDSTSAAASQKKPPKPLRYLAMSDLLTEDQADAVSALLRRSKDKSAPKPLKGVVLERVPDREFVAGDEVAAIVGKVGFGDKGMMGTEYRLEDELKGEAGKISYLRDRSGRPLWIESGFIVPPTHGNAVRLSIDLEIQRIAYDELCKQVEKANAAGGRIVVVDPRTGEVLAMADIMRDVPGAVPFPWVPVDAKGKRLSDAGFNDEARYVALREDPARKIHPALGRNRCIEDVYEPGSTFKPFVWSTITELGLISPDKMIDCEGGRWRAPDGRPLSDVVERDHQTWTEVLVNSSNIGMVKGAQLLSHQQAHDLIKRFGFGDKTQVGLPGEASGIVPTLKEWKLYTQVSVAYGHNVAVTPVQMARAFSVFARDGMQAGTLPQLRLTSLEEGEAAPVTFRVLPPEIAKLTREIMVHVVESVERRWMKDEIPTGGFRYKLFGKSGTALIPLGAPPKGFTYPKGSGGYLKNQFISSFVAGGPVEKPQLVCVAVIDDPGVIAGQSRKARYGSSAAGPLARRVLERSLTYLGVPASPRDEAQLKEIENIEKSR